MSRHYKNERYSTEPRFRKDAKGYGFMNMDKYGKKLMDTTTKTGTDAANNCI